MDGLSHGVVELDRDGVSRGGGVVEPDRKPHSSADQCLLTVSHVIQCLRLKKVSIAESC